MIPRRYQPFQNRLYFPFSRRFQYSHFIVVTWLMATSDPDACMVADPCRLISELLSSTIPITSALRQFAGLERQVGVVDCANSGEGKSRFICARTQAATQ